VAIRTDELTTPARLRVLGLERGTETAIRILPAGTGLTFQAWDERSEAAARGLAAVGVKPGDRVLLPVTADWLSYAVAYAATHKAGATAVPVLATHGEEHVRWAY
jgi:acyl-CoA synthetase (AMP-forming)/AMP-acid ligase II